MREHGGQRVTDDLDVLVVGGGPAGLSAALWLGRYRRRTLVVDAGRQRNLTATQAHGVLGRDDIAPAELLGAARHDLAAYPHVELRHGEVTAISDDGGGVVDGGDGDGAGFLVTLDHEVEVRARRVMLATGVVDELPAVDGVDEHLGTDVFHCPACDGYEARGRDVAVLGWGAHVPAFAVELLDWAASITIVADRDATDIAEWQRQRLADRGVRFADGTATTLVGDPGQLRGVRLDDGREVASSIAFFSISHHPVDVLAQDLGCELDGEGRVVVDDKGHTSRCGVYAAGDLTPGMQLINVAIAEGTVAGVSCAASLRGRATVPTAPSPAPHPRPLAPKRSSG